MEPRGQSAGRSRISRRSILIILLCLLFSAEPAFPGIEIAPTVGYRFGGEFEDSRTGSNLTLDEAGAYGLAIDFDLDRDRQIEVYLSRQGTTLSGEGLFTGDPLFDVAVEYYHVGGLYLFEGERFRPFLSGTFGLTRMDPRGSDLETETRLSVALGGGVKFFFTEKLGVRLDARGIYTAIDSDTAIFCAGGCAIRVRSNGFLQGELGAGWILRF